jgi:TonB family protein
METVVQSLAEAEAELHLLTDWSEPDSARRHRIATIGSILANIAIVLFFIWLPAGTPPPEEAPTPQHRVTPLIEPPTVLTQKAVNKTKVTNEFNTAEVRPRQRVVVPPSPPPVEHAAQPKPLALPPMPAPKAAAPETAPDVPKVDNAVKAAPNVDLSKLTASAAPPPPQIQAEEKPKVTFENATAPPAISAGRGQVPMPGNGISEAIKQAAHGNLAGGMVVGDPGAISGLGGGGINVPSAPGLQGSAIELKSDPMGVDFRPYLSQILATVRRNWMNVMPESVLRLGRRGKTAIQFSISRTGGVLKLVIASSSGSDPLDRAAVAGISASNPFPPLPAEFKGDRIILQFNFAYNMPRQ